MRAGLNENWRVGYYPDSAVNIGTRYRKPAAGIVMHLLRGFTTGWLLTRSVQEDVEEKPEHKEEIFGQTKNRIENDPNEVRKLIEILVDSDVI